MDVHTIVNCYDIDPTLHAFVACPTCYALYPLTDEALKNAESVFQADQPLPVCDERSHPDSVPCGTTLWRTRRIDRRTFVTPIRKQIFQDLKEWIGRIVATPGIEDAMDQHQQSSPPADGDPERDFVDSTTFRQFKGTDGEPYAIPQQDPSGSPDLRLVTSLGFDAFNPFHSKTAHAIVQSTALYMVILSLPEHLRYRPENMYLLTVMTGKPSQHHINFTLRKLVKQLLPFWEGLFYVHTARYLLGRRVFIVLIPAVCDTEGAHQLLGFASHSHTYFCRRCLLQIGDIHNLVPETWIMRDPAQHRELALKWREASTEEERQKIYDEHGIRWSELLELTYWDPVLFTIIDDMHFAQLGLFETHLRDVWQIDHEKPGGDGLYPEKRLQEQKKKTLWYICFKLGLRTGVRKKKSLVDQILTWRWRSGPANVPKVPPLNYNDVPDAWEGDVPMDNDFDVVLDSDVVSDSGVSDTSFDSRASSAPLVLRPAPSFAFNKDSAFEKLESKMLDFSGKPPSLSKPNLQTLKALCQDLGIHYNSIDSKRILTARIMDYMCLSLSFMIKAKFEVEEPTRTTLMNYEYTYLERLCKDYKVPPFATSDPPHSTVTKDDLGRRLLLWEHRDTPLKQTLPRHVIGRDLLEEVWADMKRTILPTWIQAPPPNWGTPAQGKLSAEEYKVVCSISLVITLIRVWGYGTEDAQSRRFQMLLNYLDLVHAIHVLLLRETSWQSREYYKSHMQRYLETVLDMLTVPQYLSASTTLYKNSMQINTWVTFWLFIIGKYLSDSSFQQANLQLILDHNADVRQDVDEALNALKNIEREDHRGMFAGTDLSVWSSTEFKATPCWIQHSTLDRITDHLCGIYDFPHSYWSSTLTHQAYNLAGVAIGRVIYSHRVRQNSVVFCHDGAFLAGTIDEVFTHSHLHPVTQKTRKITYLEVSVLEAINEQNDLYRKLHCGWLCLRTSTIARTLTIPLSSIVSHFIRTELSLSVEGNLVTHVYPVPKKVHIVSSDTQELRFLEQQVEENRRQVLQLRSEAVALRQQVEGPSRETSEVKIGLKPEHQDSLARLERAKALTLSFRTQILACLDCDLNDARYMHGITTNDSQQFWSLLEQIKSSRGEVVLSKALMHSPAADNVQDIPPSETTALLVEQCLVLCEMAGKLKGSGHEDHLFQECTDLFHRAQYL
ncbi:hypothetical protein EV359DRAFT_82317 [Lentinula novae-zelandiae]|nr:hypothetical protein EV359DRAFT_82317 [Lentinula novae-zelandiae]